MFGQLGQTELVRIVIFGVIGGLIYFIPTLTARYRHHHNQLAILLLNFLLGWTVIGWLAALIWAATSPPPKG